MRKRAEGAAAVATREPEEVEEDLEEEEERAITEALYEAEFIENVENVTDVA